MRGDCGSATWPLGRLPTSIVAVLADGHKVELATGLATGTRF